MYKKILAGILLTIAVISLFTSAQIEQKIVDKFGYNDAMGAFADTAGPNYKNNVDYDMLHKFGIAENLYKHMDDDKKVLVYNTNINMNPDFNNNNIPDDFYYTDTDSTSIDYNTLKSTNSGVSKEGESESDKEKEDGFVFDLDKENNLKISFTSPSGKRIFISIGSILSTGLLWSGTIVNIGKSIKDKYTSYEKPYRKPKKRRKKKIEEEIKEDNYSEGDL